MIIIMGASSGIGEATAKVLAKSDAKLLLAARRLDRLEAIKEEFPKSNILIQQADVTNYDDVNKVARLALDTYGSIDVLYNNAGIMPTAPIVEGRREEWKQMIDINIMGVLNGIAAVLPIMEKQKSGHIIATDSVAGHVVYPNSAVNCGT
ncbi:SDR family oxidoreductase [Paenibacillus sp. FSL R5-0345]|uniref:SDR family oxidoreductase n=1 Tax=Paenibacillus sp. FSL R5-0345 TaxID=1536770 RepID=UPI0022AFA7AF|nr:SDR family oxidoreductase [Paenibacillus sp. FSL R5-0345]